VVRIFLGLAVVALALLVANLFVGLSAGDLQAATDEYRVELQKLNELRKQSSPPRDELRDQQAKLKSARDRYDAVSRPMWAHVLLGTAAALVTVLVNSIAVTYFIGTSRWCKEVSDTFGLDPAYAQRSARIKRQSFPWSLLGILTILGVIALGAAADVHGSNRERASAFVMPHYIAALAGMVIIGLAFWMQAQKMLANGELINEIMQQVQRARDERKQAAASVS
jgi:hypothetical protein